MISTLRTILEVFYLVSILLLVKHYIHLFRNVVKLRRENKQSIGSTRGKLERAIRAHANFCETVPISIILSLFLYFHNYLFFAFPSVILLLVGRKIHSDAISNVDEDLDMRVKGMKLTLYSIYLSCLGIIFHLFQMLYYFIKLKYS